MVLLFFIGNSNFRKNKKKHMKNEDVRKVAIEQVKVPVKLNKGA